MDVEDGEVPLLSLLADGFVVPQRKDTAPRKPSSMLEPELLNGLRLLVGHRTHVLGRQKLERVADGLDNSGIIAYQLRVLRDGTSKSCVEEGRDLVVE
jgi:hypothetical protein